jgi:AraC-like DNA-binding protein
MLSQSEIDSAVVEQAEIDAELPSPANTGPDSGPGIPAGNIESDVKPERTTMLVEPETMEQYWRQITEIMERERPYLVYGFSVAQLAGMTNIKRYQLSFTINAKSGHAFQEFVNNYRIAHAITMLEDENFRSLPIKSIMIESGFRSSSVFHANFRRVTGVSPLEFRVKLQK